MNKHFQHLTENREGSKFTGGKYVGYHGKLNHHNTIQGNRWVWCDCYRSIRLNGHWISPTDHKGLWGFEGGFRRLDW